MLVSVIEYRNWTGDLTTASTTITAQIAEATSLVEDYLMRPLEEQSVTESLELWNDASYSLGWVYPSVTPVTAVASGGSLHVSSSSRIRVQSLPAASFDASWPGSPLYVEVEYTGGYTAVTCPMRLKQAIARLAFAVRTTPNALLAVAGTKSVGDISVSNTAAAVMSPLDQFVPGVSLTLRAYRRRVSSNRISGPYAGSLA